MDWWGVCWPLLTFVVVDVDGIAECCAVDLSSSAVACELFTSWLCPPLVAVNPTPEDMAAQAKEVLPTHHMTKHCLFQPEPPMFTKGPRFNPQKPSEIPPPGAYNPQQESMLENYKKGAFLEKSDRFNKDKPSSERYAQLQQKVDDLERVHLESKKTVGSVLCLFIR